jgi:hypothetical protein
MRRTAHVITGAETIGSTRAKHPVQPTVIRIYSTLTVHAGCALHWRGESRAHVNRGGCGNRGRERRRDRR